MPQPRSKAQVSTPQRFLTSWSSYEVCIFCNDGASSDGWSPKMMILCDNCQVNGTHVGCHSENDPKNSITENDVNNPAFQWFCSQECESITRKITELTGKRVKLAGSDDFTYEICRYSKNFRQSQQITSTIINLFHRSFGTANYSDGTDLIQVVCESRLSENPDDDVPDCSNFFNFVLRKGGAIVSAASIRIQGSAFAEIPYIATRDGYRREGHCRRIMNSIEALLHQLGIKYILLPAIEEVAPIWIEKFDFQEAGTTVCDAVENHVLLPGNTHLLIKDVVDPKNQPMRNPTAALGRKLKSVKFAEPEEEEEESGDDDRYSLASEPETETDTDDEDDGTGNTCLNCRARSTIQWHEEIDGFLCHPCARYKKKNRGKNRPLTDILDSISPPPATTKRPSTKPTTTLKTTTNEGELCCYNCKIKESKKWHQYEGQDECRLCHIYRESKGKLRPANLNKRLGNSNKNSSRNALNKENRSNHSSRAVAAPVRVVAAADKQVAKRRRRIVAVWAEYKCINLSITNDKQQNNKTLDSITGLFQVLKLLQARQVDAQQQQQSDTEMHTACEEGDLEDDYDENDVVSKPVEESRSDDDDEQFIIPEIFRAPEIKSGNTAAGESKENSLLVKPVVRDGGSQSVDRSRKMYKAAPEESPRPASSHGSGGIDVSDGSTGSVSFQSS